MDNVGWGTFGVYGGTIPTPRIDKLASEGIRFNNYNVEAQCTPTRSAILTGRHPVRSGTYTVPFPGQGLVWDGAVGIHHRRTPLRRRLCHRVVRQVAPGRTRRAGCRTIKASTSGGASRTAWDEAGYTAWPLFKESGMPVPMIWEGKKGEPSKPVMPLDLKVRPIVDGKYIIPKTVEFIKRNAAAKKPFFVYVGYSEMHPPMIGQPGFRRQVHPARRAVRRRHRRDGLPRRSGPGRRQGSGHRRQHHRHPQQRQRERRGYPTSRAEASNGPWRGDFLNTPFEGSMRVPAMIRWPGKVPAGVVTQ